MSKKGQDQIRKVQKTAWGEDHDIRTSGSGDEVWIGATGTSNAETLSVGCTPTVSLLVGVCGTEAGVSLPVETRQQEPFADAS